MIVLETKTHVRKHLGDSLTMVDL